MKIFYEDIDAVIFDFDGTLYNNSKVPLRLILSAPYYMFKMKKDRVARKNLKGLFFGTEQLYLAEYNKYVSAKWHQEKYLPLMCKVFSKKYQARPNVEKIFNKLKENGVKTAVLSDYGLLEKRMSAVGLSSSMADFAFFSGELGGLKPAKEVFLKVAQMLCVEPEHILVVGDREDTDGKGAENSGMKFFKISEENWDVFTSYIL